VYLGISHASIPREWSSSAPQFLGFSYMPTSLTQNDRIRRGNTYRERHVLSGIKPCHCVCTNASRGLSAVVEVLVGLWHSAFSLRQTAANFVKPFMAKQKLHCCRQQRLFVAHCNIISLWQVLPCARKQQSTMATAM